MAKPAAQQDLFPGTAGLTEGHYSGDQPNPHLRAFVEAHLREHPYDPVGDDYAVPAFAKPIDTTKATAIYNMHTYWSKKPHDAIREYIRHYTQLGDLVLDPFSGSGGTALAALMEGRKAVAIDRSPAATFITSNYCTPVDAVAVRKALAEVRRKVQKEMDWLYETKCDRCGGAATTGYTVYSQVFQCSRCLTKLPLFDCVQVEAQTAKGKAKKVNVCPHCHQKGHREIIRSQSQKFGAVPVMVSYLCENGCRPARDARRHHDAGRKGEFFKKHDLARLQEIDAQPIPHPYPQGYEMTGFSRYQRDALRLYAVKEVSDLFTKRNLRALAAIKKAIDETEDVRAAEALRFAFTAVCLNCSRLYRYRPSLKGGIAMGTYYIPQDSQIIHVWRSFEGKVRDLLHADVECDPRCLSVSTQSATNLEGVASCSVDYVFTDPPYAEKVQYGELNYVWEAWLGLDTKWHDEEIIVNDVRGKSADDWANLMRQAMAECYRVLKPGRWLSLCYHDTSEGTWGLIQDVMAEAGFVVDRSSAALFIDTGQKSYNQLTADKVTKRDLVINFRKPKPGEWHASQVFIPVSADQATFRDLAKQIIRGYLTAHPGASKDRVYDELVSHMVRSGQMRSHNFEEVLREVADEVKEEGPASPAGQERGRPAQQASRWYLKESEEAAVDAAESAREDAAAKVLTACIQKQMKAAPERDGSHYSDLFEHYLFGVKDKPRRPLADFLVDYFYKTASGTWRLPASPEEEKLKGAWRKAGTNRRIKRFAALLSSGGSVPPGKAPKAATLAEWVRHAKRGGLYEVGRLLYERGGLELGRLPEELAVAVQEDYEVCMRELERNAQAQAPAKKGGKKKRKAE